MADERDASIDTARGVAIALMVFGHAYRGVDRAGIGSGMPILDALDYIIYTFHMPLFFLVSGFFFARSSAGRPIRTILTQALLFVALPYLVYMNLALLAKLGMAPFVNRPIGDVTWLSFVIPREHYWFLAALLVAQLAGIAMRWVPPVWVLLATLALGAAFGFEGIVYGVFHFTVGFWCAQMVDDPLQRLRRAGPLLIAGFAALALVFALAGMTSGLPSSWIIPSAWFGSAAIIGLSQRLDSRPLAFIGRESMAIFLFHIYFTAGIRILLVSVFGVTSLVVHLGLATVAAIVLPALGAALLRRRKLNRWVLIR